MPAWSPRASAATKPGASSRVESRAIGAWQNEASFVALREPVAGDYAKTERDDCRSLWSEVEALLARVAGR